MNARPLFGRSPLFGVSVKREFTVYPTLYITATEWEKVMNCNSFLWATCRKIWLIILSSCKFCNGSECYDVHHNILY